MKIKSKCLHVFRFLMFGFIALGFGFVSFATEPSCIFAFDGMTPLHQACFDGDVSSVQKLVNANADVDAKTEYSVTPLSIACELGHFEIVRLLCDADVDLESKLAGGETPILIASRAGHVEIVSLLIDKGAKLNAKERRGQNALMWAAAEGHDDVVNALIKGGADLKHRLGNGFSPLMFAARQGRIDVCKRLIAAGVDVNGVISKGGGGRQPRKNMSALMFAVESAHFEMAIELVKLGAYPNDQRSGYAPLHALSWVRKTKVGDNPEGDPEPRGSGKLNSLQFVSELARLGADVNLALESGKGGRAKMNFKGATPFLVAAKTADLPLMKLLIKLGADPKSTNVDGTTALMATSGVGVIAVGEEPGTEPEVLESIKYLVGLGLDVNAVDKNGETAMHGAAYHNYPKAVALLAELGADSKIWNKKDKWNATPTMIASGKRPGSFKPSPETIEALELAK